MKIVFFKTLGRGFRRLRAATRGLYDVKRPAFFQNNPSVSPQAGCHLP